MRNRQTERIVPAFATEAEEADWWYKNRHVHDKQLLAAVRAGEAKILTKDERRRRIEASKKTPAPVVALRIPTADLALARKQAEQKGLPYQTYIKSLLHETLAKRGTLPAFRPTRARIVAVDLHFVTRPLCD